MHPLTVRTSRFSVRRVATALAAAAVPLVAVVGAVTPVQAGTAPVAGPPSGDGNKPVAIPGNPTCTGGTTEFNVEPVTDGTFNNGSLATIYIAKDGPVFRWTSNIGIAAIIVKGGPDANFYAYDPEDTADTRLHAPMNPTNRADTDALAPPGRRGVTRKIRRGQTFAHPSHISFCYAEAPPTIASPTTVPPTAAAPAEAPPTIAPPTTVPPTAAAPAKIPPPAARPAPPVRGQARFTG